MGWGNVAGRRVWVRPSRSSRINEIPLIPIITEIIKRPKAIYSWVLY